MSPVIISTVKIYGSVSHTFTDHHFISAAKERIMKIISAMAHFYLTCPEGLTHVRHYVDPVTGRAIPAQKF